MTDTAPPNIWQRINAVRDEIKRVAKDVEVKEGGRYKAVSHDRVTSALRPLMVKHGIVPLQSLQESTYEPTGRETSGGTPIYRYVAKYSVAFVNVDDPTDRAVMHSEAHALDTGDKAPGKAQSYSLKYAMLKTFGIVTGEDEEGREHEKSVDVKLSGDQVAELYALTKELHGDDVADKKLSDLGKRLYSTEKMADWPAKDFESIKSIVRKNAPKDRSAS